MLARGRAQVDVVGELLKWVLLGVVAGVLAGCSSAAFLWTMDAATEARGGHPQLVWFLPVAGLAIGLVYHHRVGRVAGGGNNLILDEIHEPKAWVPGRIRWRRGCPPW